jgi:hypothetical protein
MSWILLHKVITTNSRLDYFAVRDPFALRHQALLISVFVKSWRFA